MRAKSVENTRPDIDRPHKATPYVIAVLMDGVVNE